MLRFHRHRGNRWSPVGLYRRVWAVTDSLPLPSSINTAARVGVYASRRVRRAVRGPDAAHGPAVRSDGVFPPLHSFDPFPLAAAAERFRYVHEANEAVRRGDGSWDPAPLGGHGSLGPSIEEAALRVPGYLGAYDALGNPVYAARAEEAGEHLLRRSFADGHLYLRGHLVPDLPYSFAGVALVALWERDPPARLDLLATATKIGDRLLEYPIAGSVNHACAPVWLFAALYRATGERRFLSAMVRRVRRTALAFQLPDGAWAGHESWTWYHGITVRALVEAYVTLPFFPQWYPTKDQLAAVISRALNRLTLTQAVDGRFAPVHPSAGASERREVAALGGVRFDGRAFHPCPDEGHVESGYEMDALVTANEWLGVGGGVAHGLASGTFRGGLLRRLEFDTLAAGRYLALLHAEGRGQGGLHDNGAQAECSTDSSDARSDSL